MKGNRGYNADLAYIHDQGYGGFARGAAPGLLNYLRQSGIVDGRIVDLGCGSGIWARELAGAGYQVVGVDISSDMIEIARHRVPKAEFHVGSFLVFPTPPCRAVTALGEVFNYLLDADNSEPSLQTVWKHVFDALSPGGLLVFDVAEPGRCRGRTQAFTEGQDWTCLVEYQHDETRRQLSRRIVTFRRIGEAYRRSEEVHRQQLFDEVVVTSILESIGFEVRSVRSYGAYALGDHVVGFVARRPLA